MRTRIDLGSSGSIDLFEDIPMPLNYSIADVRNPDKRNASYSKTISIPGSKNNNKIFGHIFEIGIDGSFNPKIRTPATIYIDNVEQMKGFLQLLKVRIEDKKVTYECTVIGNVGNIFTVMGDAFLNELSMSEWNHTYNKTNQKLSWNATVGEGYVYPMIDYGNTNGTTWDVNNFYPAIYLKEYIDKIFDYTGYTYSSTFFNTEFFKRLVIPFNGSGLRLTQAQINSRLFSSTIGSSGSITLPAISGIPTDPFYSAIAPFNSETLDPGSQYNTTTYRFKANNPCGYKFDVSFNYQLNSAGSATGHILIVRNNNGTVSTVDSINFNQFGGIDNTLRTAYFSTSIYINAGEEIYVGIRVHGNAANTPKLNLTGGYFRNSISNTGLLDGDTVDMNGAIPEKIKMKDLLTSVFKLFNLYVETDKNIEDKLYIEPRNDFYSGGSTRNWTGKLDLSQGLEITPVGEVTSRIYSYSYTEDEDYYNKLYKDNYKESYGTIEFDSGNEFVTGKNETKVIFSPTPLVDRQGNDRVLSFISQSFAGNPSPQKAFNIRLLYYAGPIATNFPWTYTTYGASTSETTYPYAGHLDDTTAPTLDLNFGVPREVYYFATAYCNNNLYNKYHLKFIREITDKDSKIVSGYFYLTPKDILQLDFRDQFFVDGHFLRLNKVIDYNPTKNQLTKCEFIKIKNAKDFTSQTIEVSGGAGVGQAFNDTE